MDLGLLVIGTLQVEGMYQGVMVVYIHRIVQVSIGLDIIVQELQIQPGIRFGQIKLSHLETTYHFQVEQCQEQYLLVLQMLILT